MTYASNGTYTPAAGATSAAPGQVIQSSVWNAIFTDLSTALTQVMSQFLNSPSIQRNILFGNGGFEVWQRGAGASFQMGVNVGQALYTADRWYVSPVDAVTNALAATGLTTGSQLSGHFVRFVGQTGTGLITLGYPLDTESCFNIRGQKLTVRFSSKAGANFSSAGGILNVFFSTGTGAPTKFVNGYTGNVNIISTSVVLTTSVTEYTLTGTVAAGAAVTQAELRFTFNGVGTAGADDGFYIDDVEVEIQNNLAVSTYTQMSYDRLPLSVMLYDCQQHFYKTFPYSTSPVAGAGTTGALALMSAAIARSAIYWQYPTRMRTTPTITTYCPTTTTSSNFTDITSGATLTVTATATAATSVLLMSATVSAVDHQIYIQAIADAGI